MSLAIKEIRKKKQITQKQLAEITRLSQSYLSQIESGSRQPTLKTLCVLADSLNVSLSLILGERR
ncbi:helix-turn-helix domain-containing protein [Shimazuella kribbensis]|uniref:helix-turn-helix domain-containing protein n=1 Tax=Shimazuella kribbensis TaxID=139808 RepID=UPI0003F86E97|nr:helix-turn-helix transcriptional regulator [Shimazuella kribbensis]